VRAHFATLQLGNCHARVLGAVQLYVEKSNENFTVTIGSNLIGGWPNDWSRL
jgi:hypothetical protein